MIITVFPFKFYGFRNKVFANFVVDISLVSLTELVAAAHAIQLPVFDEMGTGLVEAKWDIFGDALLAEA